MLIKEAVIKSLDDIQGFANHKTIFQHLTSKNYYTFKTGKTPEASVSAILGDFIRNNDTRVKRFKGKGGIYLYYLTKYENLINFDEFIDSEKEENSLDSNSTHQKLDSNKSQIKQYNERDLHLLLSTYLKSVNIYSKTILHEKSKGNDSHQKWIHPDMIGVEFLKLKSKTSQTFLKVINRAETFKLNSYELKKEIRSDYELKKTFFQAVSNSSWANYGYLVAFEIEDSLHDEIERLSQSFGIGVILLKSNPYETRVLFPSKYKELDFKTIDKLCRVNKDFDRFFEQIEKLLTAGDRYSKAIEKELVEFCDSFFNSDTEIQKYCIDNSIPIENTISIE